MLDSVPGAPVNPAPLLPPTAEQTSLDVTRYARRWRVLWWVQRIGFWPALIPAGAFFFLGSLYMFGALDHYGAQAVTESGRSGDAETQLIVSVVLKMLNDAFASGWVWLVVLTGASALIIVAFLFGCGAFRLRLATAALAALALVMLVCFVGMANIAASVPSDPVELAKRTQFVMYYQLLAVVFTLVLFLVSLFMLIAQSIPVVMLWLHRLRRDLPRTHRMTRSLGISLDVPQFAWPRVSAAGVMVQAAVLLVVGALTVIFFRWVLMAVVFGSVDVFYLMIYLPVTIISVVVRALEGVPLLVGTEGATILSSIDDPPKLIVIAALLMAARGIWRIGTRLHRKRRDEIVLKDNPPVLLLRSFVDDVVGIPPNALLPRLFFRRKRLEEMIAEELTRAGPFVAIGKPGESLPQLGAHRLYLADSEWQDVVKSYIQRAERIVMIAGTTHWVQWELANTIAQDCLSKLLIVFPRISDADRATRWENMKQAFQGTGWDHAADAVDTAGALCIFPDRTGRFIAIRSRRFHESDYETALRIAAYLMRDTPAQAPSARSA